VSYLLDANVFMSAKNLHYGLDFCPAFWDWLVHNGNTGKVFSIDKAMLEAWSSDTKPLSPCGRGAGERGHETA